MPSVALDVLTEREREVLVLVPGPLERRDRGDAVHQPATAKTHVSRLLMKLESRDRAQFVVRAYEAGLVTPGVA